MLSLIRRVFAVVRHPQTHSVRRNDATRDLDTERRSPSSRLSEMRAESFMSEYTTEVCATSSTPEPLASSSAPDSELFARLVSRVHSKQVAERLVEHTQDRYQCSRVEAIQIAIEQHEKDRR